MLKLVFGICVDGYGLKKGMQDAEMYGKKLTVQMGLIWYIVCGVQNLGRKRLIYGIRYSREWLAYGNGNGHGIAGTLNTGG
jgi:hypothetical protein